MIFLSPEFIYYMLPTLLVLFVLLLRQKELNEQYFSKDVMDKLMVHDNSLTLKQRHSLFFVVGLLIIVALGEPILENGKVKVKSTSADILIAIDISDSMLAQDVYPNRLELAKTKALEVINKATNDRVGVIAFARNSYLVSPISFDTKTVSFLVSKLDTTSITQKGTDIFTMLETVAKTNTNTDKKYLLIFSDGGDATDFSAEIEFANEKGIVVYVLGMGEEIATPIKKEDGLFIMDNGKIILSKLNVSISELAIKTGGVYIQNTTSSKDIEVMLSEIMKNSEHKELKSQEIQRYTALFYYPIILAMLILLIACTSMVQRLKGNMSTSVFVIFILIFNSSPSVAYMFDFQKLDNARKSYDSKDYNSSAHIYESYAKKTDNGQAYYNAGNSYYKEKEYLKALSAYSFSRVKNKDLRAMKLSNMGNAFVRLGTRNTLDRAVKHYEASLKIKEDKFTRENLEAVKKALKENKEKEDKKKKDEEEKEKQYKEQKTDEVGDGDKANDRKNKNKNKNKKNKNNSKNKKSKDNVNPNNKKKTDDGQSKEGDNNNDDEDSNNNNGDTQGQSKELKDKSKGEVQNKKNEDDSSSRPQEMSALEQAKWFKKLSVNQSTYLYRLNEQREKDEGKNEKPW